MNKRIIAGFTALLLSTTSLQSATLLPNGQQQFINGSGVPYASGKVYFYSNYPTCTILKNTWSDSAGSVLNTNPVILDSAGRATIFGSGGYCQVLKDSNDNTVWSKYTSDTSSASNLGWGGTSGGTANAQTLSVSTFTQVDGQTLYFIAGTTNTSSMTLNVNSSGAAAVVKTNGSTTSFLTGFEVVAGSVVGVTYVAATGQFQLISNPSVQPPGEVASFAMSSCPAGWLAADGTAVSRSTYAGLYSKISTTWGSGDGSTTFNVPDLRGTFLRGTGTNGTYATAVGPAVGTYAADTYLNHSHGVTDPGHFHTVGLASSSNIQAAAGQTQNKVDNGNSSTNTTGLTVNTSTTGGTETKPKNYGVLFCIKY